MEMIPILATNSLAHTTMDALPHLAGMLMVMITLFTLWGVCALTAKLIQSITPAKVVATPPPTVVIQNAPEPNDDHIAPEIVAVIAAAVATLTGKSHRIVSIKKQSTNWEKAGRQSVLTSHRIR